MWETLCATPEAKFLAEVIPPLSADATLSASNADFKSHSVADPEACHLGADRHNLASRFMAERERLTGAKVTVGKFLEVRHV